MSVIITIIHIFVSIALIMIVLLQTGKGADMGIAFGGGSSQTLFGTTGAGTFLSKSTTVIAVIFMLTTFSLTYMWGNRNESSIMSDYQQPVQAGSQESAEKAAPSQVPQNEVSAKTEKGTQQAVVEDQTPEVIDSTAQPVQQDVVLPPSGESKTTD
ncbi:preprotein translocase subunit SecG [Candidatus Magnetomorum sp. HK-1]|nr:preprotein translocase subunit SecG [Candidatus Magnetomorum sp. HK-1]